MRNRLHVVLYITLVGGRVRHTRTICSFSGSLNLATHELRRSLLRSTITNSELEVCCRAARACVVDSLSSSSMRNRL